MLEFTKNDTLFTGDQILKELWDCLECGLCCKFFSEIPIFKTEMKELAEYVSIDEKRFIKYHLEYNKNSQTQKELMLKTPCHFQENNRCIVHKKKPLVCRMFPLCINITTGKGILSGIYLCPQATQFYEGLIDYYNKSGKRMEAN